MGLSIATGIDRPHGSGELCHPTGLPLRWQNSAQGPPHERNAVLAGQIPIRRSPVRRFWRSAENSEDKRGVGHFHLWGAP